MTKILFGAASAAAAGMAAMADGDERLDLGEKMMTTAMLGADQVGDSHALDGGGQAVHAGTIQTEDGKVARKTTAADWSTWARQRIGDFGERVAGMIIAPAPARTALVGTAAG